MGVSVRDKNNDGIWWVFVRHAGQRVSEQVGSEADAIEAKKEIEKDIRRGLFDIAALKASRAPEKPSEEQTPTAPTVAEYYKRFEKVYLETACRQGTRDRYATSYKYILPELGSIPLNEITRERVKDFVASLVAKRYQKRTKVKTYPDSKVKRKPIIEWKTVQAPLSKTSIRIILNELCSLFSHAVEENVIQSNPALKLGKFYKQAKDAREKIEPLTAEEVGIFLGSVLQHSTEFYQLFLTALHTGMRKSELAGLQWGDVDFHGKFFLLRRQLTRGRIEPTKTGKTRRIDMSDAVAAELLAMKKKRQAEYLAKGSNTVPEWVFMSRGRLIKEAKDGEPEKRGESKRVDMHNVEVRHFAKCLTKAGLRHIRFHDLRHTFATLLLMQGESPVYVKDQLGHSSIKVTVDIYGHWIPGANRAAVNRLPTIAAQGTVAVMAR